MPPAENGKFKKSSLRDVFTIFPPPDTLPVHLCLVFLHISSRTSIEPIGNLHSTITTLVHYIARPLSPFVPKEVIKTQLGPLLERLKRETDAARCPQMLQKKMKKQEATVEPAAAYETGVAAEAWTEFSHEERTKSGEARASLSRRQASLSLPNWLWQEFGYGCHPSP